MAQWKEMTTMDEWKQVLETSKEKPVLLLKHSTTCPVSANGLYEYNQYIEKGNKEVDYYLVKVIESRPISNQIAEDLGVQHASPQIICIKNEASYWNSSHWSITTEHISAVLD